MTSGSLLFLVGTVCSVGKTVTQSEIKVSNIPPFLVSFLSEITKLWLPWTHKF